MVLTTTILLLAASAQLSFGASRPVEAISGEFVVDIPKGWSYDRTLGEEEGQKPTWLFGMARNEGEDFLALYVAYGSAAAGAPLANGKEALERERKLQRRDAADPVLKGTLVSEVRTDPLSNGATLYYHVAGNQAHGMLLWQDRLIWIWAGKFKEGGRLSPPVVAALASMRPGSKLPAAPNDRARGTTPQPASLPNSTQSTPSGAIETDADKSVPLLR